MTAACTLGAARTAGRIPVLMYHRVGRPTHAFETAFTVTPERFRRHMYTLAAAGYRPCALSGFVDWIKKRRTLPEGSFVLTFDDGYASLVHHAVPILHELGWTAAVFVVTSLMGRLDSWMGVASPRATPQRLLTVGECRQLTRMGISVESHSRTHPILTALEDAALAHELRSSKDELGAALESEVRYLAYPFGQHDERVTAAARTAGYEAAFSVIPGFNRPGDDLFRLKRLDVYGSDSERAVLTKVSLGQNDGSVHGRLRYVAQRIRARLSSAGAAQ